MRFAFAFPQPAFHAPAQSAGGAPFSPARRRAGDAGFGDGARRPFMLYVGLAAAVATGAAGLLRAQSAARPVVGDGRLGGVGGRWRLNDG
jgi:hypothetical protein